MKPHLLSFCQWNLRVGRAAEALGAIDAWVNAHFQDGTAKHKLSRFSATMTVISLWSPPNERLSRLRLLFAGRFLRASSTVTTSSARVLFPNDLRDGGAHQFGELLHRAVRARIVQRGGFPFRAVLPGVRLMLRN